jgi:hypothetical protein
MKSIFFLVAAMLLLTIEPVMSQGRLVFGNPFAPTRIGSADGPLAGPNIYAQLLVGLTEEALMPIGVAIPHRATGDGIVNGGVLEVPDIPPLTSVYVQIVAWDSDFWGTELVNVPEHQLGRSAIDRLVLAGDPYPLPPAGPSFDHGAVVPLIPEPSTWALLVLGSGILLSRRWVHRRERRTPTRTIRRR